MARLTPTAGKAIRKAARSLGLSIEEVKARSNYTATGVMTLYLVTAPLTNRWYRELNGREGAECRSLRQALDLLYTLAPDHPDVLNAMELAD